MFIKYCIKDYDKIDNTYYYNYIFDNILCVKICGIKEKDILKVKCKINSEGNYYGWLDNENNLSMVYHNYIHFKVCFPYGVEAAEKAKQGKMVKLIINEI